MQLKDLLDFLLYVDVKFEIKKPTVVVQSLQ